MSSEVVRQTFEADIVCVGFGPATGGFLTTLSRAAVDETGMPLLESRVMPGMPLQVMCYERADDVGFGVSGVATRARAIRASFPDLDPSQIPMASPVTGEKMVYLLDPVGASRRGAAVRAMDGMAKLARARHHAFELPWIPPFLHKTDGLVMSIGQFNQWVASQVLMTGACQIWPGTPVDSALVEDGRVVGVRLADQGVGKFGEPTDSHMPGMDLRADLTVVADGPVGAIGQQLDREFGVPDGHESRHWAVGMKMVVDLPPECTLEPGTVLHTFGYPEPEIFGFLYVHGQGVASLGIFVPSFFESPVRTAYRYLQHWMRHPYLWRHLAGGSIRSWGAKTLAESGRKGEPILAGDGYARIGEGSGSTNMLTGSGVDEAWQTGVMLAEAVVELAREGKPYTQENLNRTYVRRRRESWVEKEARVAERARDGFERGFLPGLMGMGVAGMTGGRLNAPGKRKPRGHVSTLEQWCKGRISTDELSRIRQECSQAGTWVHDAVMDRMGWPEVEFDGKLLVSQQDALLVGGKVQAPPGYADHVVFLYPNLCEECGPQVCVEVCSGQAITPGPQNRPQFDREKCVHCGACLWSCPVPNPQEPRTGLIQFRAGAGGLHSAEN